MALLTKPAASAPTCRSPQIIEDRYIDDDKLLEICEERFGLGNYQLKVCNYRAYQSYAANIPQFKFNRWYLQAPCWLDEVSSTKDAAILNTD